MLTKPNTETQTGSFEDDDQNVTTVETTTSSADVQAEKTANAAKANQPTVEDTAKVAATTAIASAQTGGGLLAKVGNKFVAAFENQKNAFDPRSLDYDTFTRVTVGLDGFSDDADAELGKEVTLQLLSWNENFSVSPGGPITPESTKLVRYSLDGQTIDETGESTAAYVKQLKEVEGYPDASIKKYVTLYGLVIGGSHDGRMVAVQVPPRSVAKFSGYRIEHGVKAASGRANADADILKLTQIKIDGSNTKYAAIQFAAG